MRSIVGKQAEGYDFVEARTHDGRKFRILTIIDEASSEYLALVVARQLHHEDVLAALAELFIDRGPPAHIRSDNVLCREALPGLACMSPGVGNVPTLM